MKGFGMRNKLMFLLLLALGCGPAMAAWLKVASNEQSVYYLDSPVPPKVGANVMIWVLRDHKEVQLGEAGPYWSSKDQIEVDCGQRRIRRIYSSDHPQHMGEGKFIQSEHGPMSWNSIAPKTIIKRIAGIACLQS
jgi:hypothetical protein